MRQEEARRKTGLFVFYLLLAIVLIVLGINIGAYCAAALGGSYTGNFASWLSEPQAILFAAGTLFVIVVGSTWQLIALSGGGESVADMVGAEPIDPGTADESVHRLINVAEEIAIASGIPVPSLYVLEGEHGINAFVAGYSPTEAVMVVTRGALDKLNRDELQGVVGHEFSHILNGDMRINIRLMAILAGILLIGKLGEFFVRSLRSPQVPGRRVRSGLPPFFLLVLGVAAFVVGYIGLFFGRLIKASISRQREILADASSVQFTRNPSGLASALWKIRGDQIGSRLWGAYAEDLSHMCFGQGQRYFLESLMATHPPLEVRIKAIDSAFLPQRVAEQVIQRQKEEARQRLPVETKYHFGEAIPLYFTADAISQSIGNPAPVHDVFAAAMIEAIPPDLHAALYRPDTAMTAIYALLLSLTEHAHVKAAEALLAEHAGAETAKVALNLSRSITRLGVKGRLPLIDLAMPALKQLTMEERQTLLDVTERLIEVDQRFKPFEFVLVTILEKHLAKTSGQIKPVRFRTFDAVLPEIRLLLSTLARSGSAAKVQADAAFARAILNFTPANMAPAAEAACTMEGLRNALDRLALLSPLLKRPIIQVCADCVLHDGLLQPEEGELLRAVAERLDCPMPPLVA